MSQCDCVVIGDAMIDVLLPLSGIGDIATLAQGGVANTRAVISPGGSANVAFYVSKLGGSSTFVGRVGDDPFGRMFLEDLERHGVRASVSVASGETTGLAFVIVLPNGERFFIDDRGANDSLAFNDIDLEAIRHSRYLFLSGYSCQAQSGLHCMLKLLKETGKDATVIFNPGAPNLASRLRAPFADLVREHVDILVLNEAEGECLAGRSSEAQMLRELLALAETVIITRGERGSVLAGAGVVCPVDAMEVTVQDTTGAGDAYVGGLIRALCSGWDLPKAGSFASRVAARCVSQLGARADVSDLRI